MKAQLLKNKSRILQKEQEAIQRKLVINNKLHNSKLMISGNTKTSQWLEPNQSVELPKRNTDMAVSMSLQLENSPK